MTQAGPSVLCPIHGGAVQQNTIWKLP